MECVVTEAAVADVIETGPKATTVQPRASVRLGIEGMTCAACALRVERALGRVAGVAAAEVNLALERADVALADTSLDPHSLEAAVAAAGYQATLIAPDAPPSVGAGSEAGKSAAARGERLRLAIAATISAVFLAPMIANLLGVSVKLPAMVQLALAAPVQFWIGGRFYAVAWKALRAGSGNMDLLVAIGTSAAFFYSLLVMFTGAGAAMHLYFEAAAVVTTLVLFGKWLEARAKRGTTRAIRELMALKPTTARRALADSFEEVPIEAIASGDIVLVRAGERIPVDGEIIEGESEVDEALVTGESLPVRRVPDDPVIEGAINGLGHLKLRATTVGRDGTLNRIIRLVENAQAGKAPVQRLVDRLTAVFVPVVVAIAALTFAGWLVAGAGLEHALISAVSVLVIACPCALGLATPTALVAGTGAAARAGILIKDIEALERARGLDTIAFDKTGTLTEGRPRLTDIVVFPPRHEHDVLATVAAVQAESVHPLARAVVAHLQTLDLPRRAAQAITTMPGAGMRARVEGEDVAIGNRALMAAGGIDLAAAETLATRFATDGKATLFIAIGGSLAAAIALADPPRPSAAATVAALVRRGLRVVMLSGDTQAVATAIARRVGITTVEGEMRPEGKVALVCQLQADGRRVAMVGDGINDAPALAAADVGIAMGGGADVALETAGFALLRPDPALVPAALDAAAAIRRRIRYNLFWAFFYNVVAIPAAALGLLNPQIAGAAMALSSVSVVTSSLVLRGWRPHAT